MALEALQSFRQTGLEPNSSASRQVNPWPQALPSQTSNSSTTTRHSAEPPSAKQTSSSLHESVSSQASSWQVSTLLPLQRSAPLSSQASPPLHPASANIKGS